MPKRARCPHCDRLFDRGVLDNHVMRCRAQYQKDSVRPMAAKRSRAVVDGNNVAYHLAPSGTPRVRNLILSHQSLTKAGYRVVTVISAALLHHIDQPDVLQHLVDLGQVIKAKTGTNDDLTIIRLAQRDNADIVSNDRFLDWHDKCPWLESRLKRYRLTPTGLILS